MLKLCVVMLGIGLTGCAQTRPNAISWDSISQPSKELIAYEKQRIAEDRKYVEDLRKQGFVVCQQQSPLVYCK